jgi:hypothetical protein
MAVAEAAWLLLAWCRSFIYTSFIAVQALLPFVPGETLGSLVGPASGGASVSYPY